MPDIIFSSKDTASKTIFKQITENYEFEESDEKFEHNKVFIKNNVRLITTNRRLIFCNHLDILKSDLLIFATKHKSESGRPSLLVHCTGNWGDSADFGGRPKEIAMSSGSAIKVALIELFRQKEILGLHDFDVNLEVTHHGPTELNSPLVFIELGSTAKDWENNIGGLAVAHAIMKVATSKEVFNCYIGIGGPHYSNKFASIVANPNKNFTISHIIPKYMLDYVDESILRQCITRTKEKIEGFVFDWKGMNAVQRNKIINLIQLLNYDYKRIRDFK